MTRMMPSMSSAAQFDAGGIGKQLSPEEREWPESERAGFDFLETESSHQAIECIHGIAVLGRATLVNPAPVPTSFPHLPPIFRVAEHELCLAS